MHGHNLPVCWGTYANVGGSGYSRGFTETSLILHTGSRVWITPFVESLSDVGLEFPAAFDCEHRLDGHRSLMSISSAPKPCVLCDTWFQAHCVVVQADVLRPLNEQFPFGRSDLWCEELE